MEKCKTRKCEGKIINQSHLMMGVEWECTKCGAKYTHFGIDWQEIKFANLDYTH